MENSAISKSSLSLENRQNLSLTGIKKVKSTEPNQVVAQLDNCMIIVSGQNLAVQSLSIHDGTMELSGLVSSIRYTGSHQRRFSVRNMFK